MTTDHPEHQPPSPWELLKGAFFEIGGKDQLSDVHAKWTEQPTDDEAKQHLEASTEFKTDLLNQLLE